MRSPKRPPRKGAVDVIYGINIGTLEVQRVIVDADGTLTKLERDKSYSTHRPEHGRSVEGEVRSFYNLSDLLWLPMGPNLDSHPEVLRLERKADGMRQAKDARGK